MLDWAYLPGQLASDLQAGEHMARLSDNLALYVSFMGLALEQVAKPSVPQSHWKWNYAILQEEDFLPANTVM